MHLVGVKSVYEFLADIFILGILSDRVVIAQSISGSISFHEGGMFIALKKVRGYRLIVRIPSHFNIPLEHGRYVWLQLN